MTAESVKVVFMLEPDEHGWPPVSSERVWATQIAHDEYELDNVPWFVRGVAYGDRVSAEPDDDGVLWVKEVVAWSGRYTIRVIPLDDGPLQGSAQGVVDRLSPLGAECESALPVYGIVAVDIPPTARLAEIKALLRHGEAEGWWEYEEGCIDETWAAL